jgi:hypothetical protein
MSKYSIFLYVTVLFLVLTACDYKCDYSYVVKNRSSGSIKLTVEGHYDSNGDLTQQEFNIPVNSEQILFIDKWINDPYDREIRDTMTAFKTIEVVKDDTVRCVSDFKKREKWEYVVTSSKHPPYGAKYTAEVSDNDF